MKRTLATLTTIVVLGLTPIAASADAGTAEDGASTSWATVDHDEAMMSGDNASIHSQVGAGMSHHADGGMHAVMQHADDAAMNALMNAANPTAMHALMRGGPANPAGRMP